LTLGLLHKTDTGSLPPSQFGHDSVSAGISNSVGKVLWKSEMHHPKVIFQEEES
jgi:hypothetical protein